MDMGEHTRFAIGMAFFVGAWIALFALSTKSRKPMLWASVVWGHAGPISEYWHRMDYWQPDYVLTIQMGNWVFGIEDYVFAFTFTGLCGGLFEWLASKCGQPALARFKVLGFVGLVILGLGCVLVGGAAVTLLRLNSLHASVLTFLIAAGVILALRTKWIVPALLAASIMGFLMWIFYWAFFLRLFPNIITEWWNVKALSGITLAGVPLEEVIWAWGTALLVGPAVRICMEQGSGSAKRLPTFLS